MRPIQAILAALFVAGSPFLFAFGPAGLLILFDIPTHYAPELSVMQQDMTAALSLVVGLLIASCFWSTAPQLRAPFGVLTGAGLFGVAVLFVAVF